MDFPELSRALLFNLYLSISLDAYPEVFTIQFILTKKFGCTFLITVTP